jgi:hypothetical protein
MLAQVCTQVLSDGRSTQPGRHCSQLVPVRLGGHAQRAVPVVSVQVWPAGQVVAAHEAAQMLSWLLSWYPSAQVSQAAPVYSGRQMQTPWALSQTFLAPQLVALDAQVCTQVLSVVRNDQPAGH